MAVALYRKKLDLTPVKGKTLFLERVDGKVSFEVVKYYEKSGEVKLKSMLTGYDFLARVALIEHAGMYRVKIIAKGVAQ